MIVIRFARQWFRKLGLLAALAALNFPGMFIGPLLASGTLTIDGSVVYQPIDGFGVNANSLSWTNDELKPVIDAYINQAGMTLFHAIVENSNWEATNDNSNPNVMNWAYYTN